MNRRIGALSALLMLALIIACERGAPQNPAVDATAEPPASESVEEAPDAAKALDKAGEELEKSARPEEDADTSVPDVP